MAGGIFSSESAIVFYTLCLSYFMDSAVSTKCYKCWSMDDADCVLNPEQDKFAVDCAIDNSEGDLNTSEFQCYKSKIQATDEYNFTRIMISKGCIDKSLLCEDMYANSPNVKVLDICEICDSDLCNSSPLISAKFSSLIVISLTIMLFTFWK